MSDRRFDAGFALVLTNDSARRYHEAQRRAAERVPRQFQEAGHLSFEGLLGKIYNPHQSLSRIRWERTLVYEGGGLQGAMTMQCIDPADLSRLIVRLVPCNHEDDVTFLTSEASDIRDNFHPNLLHMTGVHHHLVSPDDPRTLLYTYASHAPLLSR